jgi:homoaconitate hydratase
VNGVISGPGIYKRPEDWAGVSIGEGEVVESGTRIDTTLEAMEKFIGQLDSMIESSSKAVMPEESTGSGATEVDIVPGFPEKVEGEILFLDADNISTDGIYPGKPSQADNHAVFANERHRQVHIPGRCHQGQDGAGLHGELRSCL